jgi:hypothetical protein
MKEDRRLYDDDSANFVCGYRYINAGAKVALSPIPSRLFLAYIGPVFLYEFYSDSTLPYQGSPHFVPADSTLASTNRMPVHMH